MRKITDIDNTFEKYGIVQQDCRVLFNQSFFLAADDVQSEGTLNNLVIDGVRNTPAYDLFTDLDHYPDFMEVVERLVFVNQRKDGESFYVKDESIEKPLQSLLRKHTRHNAVHLDPGYLSVFATPHKGLDTLKLDIPSDVADPAAFIAKIQELYQVSRKPVFYLNLTLTTPSLRGKLHLQRITWILNRVLTWACEKLPQYVPGTVTVFATSFRELQSIDDVTNKVIESLSGKFLLWADDVTFSQWLRRHLEKLESINPEVDDALFETVFLARRSLQVYLPPKDTQEFVDFCGTWIRNNDTSFHPSHDTKQGLYLQVFHMWQGDTSTDTLLEPWLRAELQNADNVVVGDAFTLHNKVYAGGVESFIENITKLL